MGINSSATSTLGHQRARCRQPNPPAPRTCENNLLVGVGSIPRDSKQLASTVVRNDCARCLPCPLRWVCFQLCCFGTFDKERRLTAVVDIHAGHDHSTKQQFSGIIFAAQIEGQDPCLLKHVNHRNPPDQANEITVDAVLSSMRTHSDT